MIMSVSVREHMVESLFARFWFFVVEVGSKDGEPCRLIINNKD